MARQPQPQDVSASMPRQQSAPINIPYGEQNQYHFHPRYWQEEQERNRWQQPRNGNNDDDLESVSDTDYSEHDETNGFSSGVIEPLTDKEEAERQLAKKNAEEQQRREDAIRQQQKIAEMMMSDDLFDQLLAENERQLRKLIRFVDNAHLVLD